MPDTTTPDQFSLIVVSPDEIVFEGKVKKLIAPTPKQDIAILPNHTPLYAQLSKGDLLIDTAYGKSKTIPIESGIIRVKLNQVSIIIGFDALRH